MKPFAIMAAVLVGSAGGLPLKPANAEDASWGCQVLLCAASQNPSWHGVPYCVPPMTRLIAAMSKPGFSWPICHEANAGKPGREIYGDCPADTKIGYSSQGNNGWRGEPDQCVKTINVCLSPSQRGADDDRRGTLTRRNFSDHGDSCIQKIATPRPRRADPYFFDIPNDKGVRERFWFNLNH